MHYNIIYHLLYFPLHSFKLNELTTVTAGVNVDKMVSSFITRSQAVARIADRTAKNCRGHVT